MDFLIQFIRPKLAAVIAEKERLDNGAEGASVKSVQALLFELNALTETASKKFPQATAPSSRFATITIFELKGVLYHTRKQNLSDTQSKSLFQVLSAILHFRTSLYQIYLAIGTRRLRSLSMERASHSIESLHDAFQQSPITLFDAQTASAARLEAATLAALLRVVSHTARLQFAPALLAAGEARAHLDEWRLDAEARGAFEGGGGSNGGHTLHYAWIFDWLERFHQSCLSNIELLFDRHLRLLAGDAPTLPALPPQHSYVAMVEAFVSKTEALNFSVVLDCNRSARAAARATAGSGETRAPPILYALGLPLLDVFAQAPLPATPPSGVASWPCVFSRPQATLPVQHMPNVISLILSEAMTLLAQRVVEPLLHYDAAVGHAYAVIRLQEPHLFAVTVWKTKLPQQKIDVASRFLPHLALVSRHSLFAALVQAQPTSHKSARY